MLVLILTALVSPARAEDQPPTLYKVEIKGERPSTDWTDYLWGGTGPSGDEVHKDVTLDGLPERMYYITFKRAEGFQFIVPVRLLNRGAVGNTIYSLGFNSYQYDHDGDPNTRPLLLNIPNRILRVRQAMLAARTYFRRSARQAGTPLRLRYPNQLIKVSFGFFSPKTRLRARANADFFSQHIRFPHNTDDADLESTAVHEYFHIVQGAVRNDGNEDKHLRYHTADRIAYIYLEEMTAEWATDEALRIAPTPPEIKSHDLDAENSYLERFEFFEELDQPFFRGTKSAEYRATFLIKYLAEQLAAGQDVSRAPEILKLIRATYESGPITRASLLQEIGKILPQDRFKGVSWKERWQRFFTAFIASGIVQGGRAESVPAGLLGYHDEGFTNREFSYPFPHEERFQDYSRVPTSIFQEPAADDTERARRLAELADGGVLPHLSSSQARIGLKREIGFFKSEVPRSAFVYAKGEPGTEVFLLQQGHPRNATFKNQKKSSFVWNHRFTLLDGGSADSQESVVEQTNLVIDPNREDLLWIGLVNNGADRAYREVEWSYVMTPRLIEDTSFSPFGTHTARLVDGAAYDRSISRPLMANGDDFVIEVKTTGKVHIGPDDVDDIPRANRNIDITFHCGDAETPVVLAVEGDKRLSVSSKKTVSESMRFGRLIDRYITYSYRFSGRIDDNNTALGDCKARIRLTSLLNLGGGDEQVDESFAFTLHVKNPVLRRLVVSSDGPPILYDSENGFRQAPVPREDAYELDIEATFSLPMLEEEVEITAGRKPPFDSYRVGRVRCRDDNRICGGRLTVPAGEVPAAGMLLRFAVGGESSRWVELDTITGRLDADPLEPGPQPDTRHFVVLGVDEIYLFSQSSRAFFASDGKYVVRGDSGPFDFEFELWPYRGGPPYASASVWRTEAARRLLGQVKKAIEAIEKEFEEASDDPEAYAARFVEKPKMQWPDAPAFDMRDKEELGRELVENRRLALGRQRSRRAFLEARYLPLLDAVHRVMNGYKLFAYNEELSGPVPFSYAGQRVEWHTPGGPYTQDWASHAGGPDVVSFTQGRLSARGWSIDVTDGALSSPPKLVVWDFWPSDLEKAQMLLDLSYPDSFAKAPEDELSGWIEGSDERRANDLAERLADDTDKYLIRLCVGMWSLFPESQRPDLDLSNPAEGLDEGQRICRLPPVDGTRLINLRSLGSASGLPIDIEGSEFSLYYDPNIRVRVDRTGGGFGGSNERQTRVVSTLYEKGQIHREEMRMHSSYEWNGEFINDWLWYILGYDRPNHITTWSIVDSSSPHAVLDQDYPQPWLLIQTAEEVAHGTVRSQRQWENVFKYGTGNYRWDVHYRVERIGATPVPDPDEPLPAWTEPGEEPRREPTPRPRPAPEPMADPEPQREDFARSFDPDTGITTESRRGPDGSVTVTRTGRDGKVISRETRPPGQPGLPSATISR